MTEFAVARQFAESVLAACNALETADAAEERARLASISAGNANNAKRQAEIDAAKVKADAATEAGEHKARLDKAERDHAAKLAAEKAEHDRYVENARGQVEAASETLSGLQTEIRLARQDLANLNAERARVRAAFAESAAKL